MKTTYKNLVLGLSLIIGFSGVAHADENQEAARETLTQIRSQKGVLAEGFSELEKLAEKRGHQLWGYHFYSEKETTEVATKTFDLSLEYRRELEGPFRLRGGNGKDVVVIKLQGLLKKDAQGKTTEVYLKRYDVFQRIVAPNIPHGESSSAGRR
jgi:hypothetical protein